MGSDRIADAGSYDDVKLSDEGKKLEYKHGPT